MIYEGLYVGVWGEVVRAILKFPLYFIGMSHFPALPWCAYTPGRLPYETDRAACQKFWNKPLRLLGRFFPFPRLTLNETPAIKSVGFLPKYPKWDEAFKIYTPKQDDKYPCLFHIGVFPHRLG